MTLNPVASFGFELLNSGPSSQHVISADTFPVRWQNRLVVLCGKDRHRDELSGNQEVLIEKIQQEQPEESDPCLGQEP